MCGSVEIELGFKSPFKVSGIGFPTLELLGGDVLVKARVYAQELWQPEPDEPCLLNFGIDLNIRDLFAAAAKVTSCSGMMQCDTVRPNGFLKKQPDVSCLVFLVIVRRPHWRTA